MKSHWHCSSIGEIHCVTQIAHARGGASARRPLPLAVRPVYGCGPCLLEREPAVGLFGEFKKFIARGNVLDLAVGVIIGAAFGRIVTSLTESIIMPLISWMFGDIDFSNWFILLGDIPATFAGDRGNYAQLKAAGVLMLGYGDFATQMVDFLIVAFALFLLLKSVNRILEEMQEKQKQVEDSSKSADVPTDPQLDVLKQILAELRHPPARPDAPAP
jgi:large conductance mechanosensitive channel